MGLLAALNLPRPKALPPQGASSAPALSRAGTPAGRPPSNAGHGGAAPEDEAWEQDGPSKDRQQQKESAAQTAGQPVRQESAPVEEPADAPVCQEEDEAQTPDKAPASKAPDAPIQVETEAVESKTSAAPARPARPLRRSATATSRSA